MHREVRTAAIIAATAIAGNFFKTQPAVIDVRAVALEGQSAPGAPANTTFASFQDFVPSPYIGQGGAVLFHASLAGPNISQANALGFYSWTPAGGVQKVYELADQAPDTASGVTFSAPGDQQIDQS